MFAVRYVGMTFKQTSPLKFQVRHQSIYHRGVSYLFKKNLLLTNSLTSGLCMAIGDLVQQEIEYQQKILPNRYDWGRAVRMLIVGTAMGPLHHYYYCHLDKVLPKVNLKNVFIKILCDQGFASPLTILSFFYGMGILEKRSLYDITMEIKTKFLYVYTADCLYWPPVQFVNFYFLPTCYRVVYINVATMIFNIFLSFMKHYDQHEK
ncbi:PXMP2/4 family protein 4-like [Trichoplusia ni]|uniref:PXMP2/4 family protein 4-like n=1 Tax=Trichoplusia ni TaxID=7111 RepID=A0A7E5WGD8_TRINI|nr:PXMP2/4 family protein 4-like [Trichoplusia ni]XP_026739773.1 PXMP2/4 family protein 4-like [Trichoplusia ni]